MDIEMIVRSIAIIVFLRNILGFDFDDCRFWFGIFLLNLMIHL